MCQKAHWLQTMEAELMTDGLTEFSLSTEWALATSEGSIEDQVTENPCKR